MSDSPLDAGVPESFRNGRYVATGVLGQGSQGETLDAVDKLRGCPVALKRFRIKGARSWKDVELAEREARVLSSIEHPNLPRYVEHFEEDGCLFLVTERIEGESLSALRAAQASFSEADVVRLLDDARRVLRYLHHRAPPVIHRDIKPGNVILRPDGSYAFVDFGAVRDSLKPEGGSTVVGTFGFMAPEQFQGRALPASDVYAVAATALTLLTGRDPEDLPHVGLGIDVRQALGPSANPQLVAVLSAMLEPDPDRRVSQVPAVSTGRWQPQPQGAPSHGAARLAGSGRAWEWPAAGWGPRQRRAWRRAGWARPPANGPGLQWAPQGLHQRRSGALPLPFVMAAVLVLVLVLARIANFAMLRVGLPVLLMVLSVLLGRAMRRAASAVIRAGAEADTSLRDASRRVRGVSQWSGPTEVDASGQAAPAAQAQRRARVTTEGSEAPRRARPDSDDQDLGERTMPEAERPRQTRAP